MNKFSHCIISLAAVVSFAQFNPRCTSSALAQTVPPGTSIANVDFKAYTADPTVAEASDFTAVADVAGSLSAKTFRFYSAGDVKCYQPWYDVDNASVAPAAVGACILVEVDIATGDTAATVAGNTRTVLNAAPYTTYFAITGATTHVIATSLTKGAATDGNIGTSGFAISKTQGVSGTLGALAADVVPGLMGWRICNAAVNTSTWLAVGESTLDPELDGIRLGKGKCHDCPSCSVQSLKDLRVSAQAASDAYAIIQFKQ